MNEPTVSTASEDVERLAESVMQPDYLAPLRHTVAATLRALLAERDAAQAEAERLREALKDVASFLPDLEGASRYLRRISDMRPAMEHAAALTGEPRHDR